MYPYISSTVLQDTKSRNDFTNSQISLVQGNIEFGSSSIFFNGCSKIESNNFTNNQGITQPAAAFKPEIIYESKFQYCNVVSNVASKYRTIFFGACNLRIEFSNFVSNVCPIQGVIFTQYTSKTYINNVIFARNSGEACIFPATEDDVIYLYSICFIDNSASKYKGSSIYTQNYKEVELDSFPVHADCQTIAIVEPTEFFDVYHDIFPDFIMLACVYPDL